MKPTPDATLAATRAWSAFPTKPNCDTRVKVQAPRATKDLPRKITSSTEQTTEYCNPQ